MSAATAASIAPVPPTSLTAAPVNDAGGVEVAEGLMTPPVDEGVVLLPVG